MTYKPRFTAYCYRKTIKIFLVFDRRIHSRHDGSAAGPQSSAFYLESQKMRNRAIRQDGAAILRLGDPQTAFDCQRTGAVTTIAPTTAGESPCVSD
jgi:hypothetical protein